VDHLRFEIALRNAIRARKHEGEHSAPVTPTPADRPAPEPTPRQKIRAFIKRAILLLLTPLKPGARYARQFLVGQIQANIEQLRGSTTLLSNEMQTVQIRQTKLEELIQSRAQQLEEIVRGRAQQLEEIVRARMQDANTQLIQTLKLMQLLHAKVDDVGLRSRGALAIDDATFALRTLDGFVLIPRSDTMLLLMLLDAGPEGLEPGTRRIVCKLLRPGMMFVDVGAHVGLLTLAGARAVGPGGKVLAIEPLPICFELLNRGLAINGLQERVEVKCQAAGARRDRCKFFVGSVLGHSSLIRAEGLPVATEIEVDVLPLDEVVPRGQRVDLVKIDVEGAELAVLEGMRRVIADSPELAIIAEFGPSHLKATQISPEAWLSAFRNYGFEAFVIDELSAECRPADLTQLAGVESVNILFARTEASILARVM
jgi:FkbM family methyltransferase